METSCQICGKPLTNDVSVMRGIGPIWRAKQWASKTHQGAKICDYDVELFNDEKICIIREINNLKSPTISLTNCIETVLSRVIEEYNLCGDEWDFVEHANHPNLMGGYDEYDLVSLDNGSIKWRYLWHSDAKGEEHEFSRDLLVTRVNHYRLSIWKVGELGNDAAIG